jgi:hypothetical protein
MMARVEPGFLGDVGSGGVDGPPGGADHRGHPKFLMADQVVAVDKTARDVVEMAFADPGLFGFDPRRFRPGLPVADRPGTASGPVALRRSEFVGGGPGRAGIGNELPVGRGDQVGHADIDPDLVACRRQRSGRDVGAEHSDFPPPSPAADRQSTGLAPPGLMEADRDGADTVEDQAAGGAVEFPAGTVGPGDRVPPARTLEPGIAGLPAGTDPAEEPGERLIETRQRPPADAHPERHDLRADLP